MGSTSWLESYNFNVVKGEARMKDHPVVSKNFMFQ